MCEREHSLNWRGTLVRVEVANEFDAEDGHVPEIGDILRPRSREDRVRRAFLTDLVGGDGIAAVLE